MSDYPAKFEPHKKAYHEIAKDMEDLAREIVTLGEGLSALSEDRDLMEQDRDMWVSLAVAFCRAMLEVSQDPDDENPITDQEVAEEITRALMFLRDKMEEEENSDEF